MLQDNSNQDSTETRAIKNNAIAEYEEAQAQERAEVASNAVGEELGILVTSMGQYPEFKKHMGSVANAVINLEDGTEIDFNNIGYYDCELELDNLIEIKNKSQELVNRSRGGKYANVADVMFEAINGTVLDYGEVTF